MEHLEDRRLLSVSPKNVILMIGDGMGSEQVEAGNFASGGNLSFENFPYQGEITTYSANSSVTDSAAAGTSLATGEKVNNNVISVALPGDGSELPTSLEHYQATGKAVGLVTTTYVTHATPAAFGAHETSRSNYSQIADDYLTGSRPDVLFGGASYIGGAAAAGYTVVTDADEMNALDTETVGLVSGQFGSGDMPYEYDGLGALPHLSEMTGTALDILDTDPDGFFLMVEGGRIDHAAHSNDSARMQGEVIEFSNAVQAVIDWVDAPGDGIDWTNTLVIVTADHETGGLDFNAGTIVWGSTGHTAANVPIYAKGPNAETVGGIMDNTDVYALTTGIETATIVSQGSDWKYLVTDTDQGAAWQATAFDDTTWPEGPAALGFGDAHINTTIGYGPSSSNKYTTTYFRHSFEVTGAADYSDLDLGVMRDDGAIVYLNGQEVARSNMPTDPISYATFASATVGGADETTFFSFALDPALLVEGTNVLAVELHQANLTSSDLGFDLELTGTRLATPDVTPPTATMASPADNVGDDLDPALGTILVGYHQSNFQIQLSDSGIGIDDATVSSADVVLKFNGIDWSEGEDYTFSYDSVTDLITLTPIVFVGAPVFYDATYLIQIDSIEDRSGNVLQSTLYDVTIDLSLADTYTIGMLPDTQYYSESYPEIFTAQTQWIADHVTTHNIAFVSQVGDLVQNGGGSAADNYNQLEWDRADAAMAILDGQVPYSAAPGNHDYDTVNDHTSAAEYLDRFGPQRYSELWYKGATYDGLNHHQVFTAGNRQFHHIALEWEPRDGIDSAIVWAQQWIDEYPDLPVILSTHAYLNGSGRITAATSPDGLSGEELFQRLVKPNPQIFMVLSGHVSTERNQTSLNDAGLEVFEIVADYQNRTNGGDGWMRLMKFSPEKNRIDVKTFSPTLDQFETDANSEFSLNIDFDTRFDFTFAPTAAMVAPEDNGLEDLDPADNAIIVPTVQSTFEIQLADVLDDINDASVTPDVLSIVRGSTTLVEGTDYTFSYDGTTDLITLTPIAPQFGNGDYQIDLNTGASKIVDLPGDPMDPTTITVLIDTSIVVPETVTFQQGIGGYTSMGDAMIRGANPDTNYSDSATEYDNITYQYQVNTDTSSAGAPSQVLLRFDGTIGSS
ncbi:MAG: alkaline phosphatase, partial [Thermoguttaceae bacterium]